MKKSNLISVMLLVVVLSFLVSCSDSEESTEKSALRKKQDEIAQDAVNAIKIPLDQAKSAAESANQQVNRAEEIPQN